MQSGPETSRALLCSMTSQDRHPSRCGQLLLLGAPGSHCIRISSNHREMSMRCLPNALNCTCVKAAWTKGMQTLVLGQGTRFHDGRPCYLRMNFVAGRHVVLLTSTVAGAEREAYAVSNVRDGQLTACCPRRASRRKGQLPWMRRQSPAVSGREDRSQASKAACRPVNM